MQDFRQLKIWERAHQLVLDVYRTTSTLPPEERFGLTAQIRRSAASIPSNIAEGCVRGGDREFAHFVRVSLGSASELEYHILLAHDLGFLHDADYQRLDRLAVEIKRMATKLVQKLKRTGAES